jgi:hypothetical protein
MPGGGESVTHDPEIQRLTGLAVHRAIRAEFFSSLLRRENNRFMIRSRMKKALLIAFYTLGLSAFFPLLILNNRSNAAWPMFLAPIIAAVFAEVLARTVRFTKETAENRVIWLIAAFILLAQVAKFTLNLGAADGFTEYLALNALYQIVLLLIYSASGKRGAKGADIRNGHLV